LKKPSKITLRNKLDKIVSEIVRSRAKCQMCGRENNLQCCHIFSRTYNNTRWSLDNLLCLCASCHFFTHKNPVLFGDFVRTILGKEKYELLKEARNQITQFTIEDLQIKYQALKEIAEAK